MKYAIAAAAAALTMSASSAVLAADMGVVMMDEPVMMTDPGFDWDGLYVGVKGAGTFFTAPASTTSGELSFVLGANGTVDSVLFGLEGWVGGYSSTAGVTGVVAGVEGRLGYLITPDAVIYGNGSLQHYFGAATPSWAGIGAGVEFAMTDELSLDVNYTYYGWNNAGTATDGHNISASLNYHF